MEIQIKRALELLKEHKITVRKAASMTNLSYKEMLDLASKTNIDIGYTLKDLNKNMRK